ncbi:hypothetical protein DSECCO2_613090 [anaerobic digester metagenome]
MEYLFWNTNKNKDINTILTQLITTYVPKIIAFAEYDADINVLIQDLEKLGYSFYEVPILACNRIRIITRFKKHQITAYEDGKYFTIKEIPYTRNEQHLVVFVHFPSKMYPDEMRMQSIIGDMLTKIEAAKKSSGINKVVICGDFNMNPFEVNMIAANSLHAISSRKHIKNKKYRESDSKKYYYYYNPMWNLMGDENLPEGTYFYDKSGFTTYYWNYFDQVIVSSDLIDDINPNNIKIIDEVNDIQLKDNYSRPDKKFSDHFPLYFVIKGANTNGQKKSLV